MFLSAALAGALNSVAGGGSFISFPALLFAGVSPVVANATNSVALWPAGIGAAVAYRKELGATRRVLVPLGIASLAGGIAGAVLLTHTPDATFDRQIPWLLLAASALFTLGPAISARFLVWTTPREDRGRAVPVGAGTPRALAITTAVQLAIAVYGGYFGGGMGILMLAAMSLLGMTEIHAMNGLKSILGVLINGAAVVVFIVEAKVAWGPGIVMVFGGTLGGFGGGWLATRMKPIWVRRVVAVVAWGMTAYFFARAYR